MASVIDLNRILNGLNSAQESAVKSPFQVVQILAPPGSGKTKTLTSRVSWLLCHKDFAPWNIICLTFTIKSAREMKSRIAKQIGNGLESKLVLGTFHSVCLRYLRSYGQLIELRKGFGILDASDTQAIILRIVKREKLTIDAKVAKTRISKCKARNETPVEALRRCKKTIDQQEFEIVYQAYQDHLEASNLLDYDDILMLCVELLTRHPECVSNVEAVLIDEFQDTNNVQFMLMQLFAQQKKRITTVGDPDQSIYGWRSAEIKNLERMRGLYEDIQVIHLEENYRSSGAILQAAQEVIEQDSARPSKSLQATHCGGTTPVLRMLFSAETEAQWIVAEVKRCLALTGGNVLNFSDFAILIRSASQSRQLELAMAHAAIPYRMVGGLRFFDRVEVKILLDYLRIISHTGNSDAIARVLNVPPRGVGSNTPKDLLEEATSLGIPLWDLIRDTIQGSQKCATKVSKQSERGLATFFNIIETARKKICNERNTATPFELLEHVIKRIEFRKYLERMYLEDTENVRWANVEELLVQAADVALRQSDEDPDTDALPPLEDVEQEQTGSPAEEALSIFLSNVALATELQSENQTDGEVTSRSSVTISTMHAAKGLEWPVVFVPSVYMGSMPHSRAEDHDEERRLLYVAMTRAQALLYVSCPTRSSGGDETTLSPFLDTKEVRPCFVDQGPTFHTGRVFDLCEILRRACPSEEELLEAQSRIEVLDDDEYRWPLDGSAGQEALWPRKDRIASVHSGPANGWQDFRIVNKGAVSLEPLRSGSNCLQQERGSGTAAHIDNGFMSAASQLKLQRQKGIDSISKAPSQPSLHNRPPVKTHQAGKQVRGQHTLTGMWSGPSRASVVSKHPNHSLGGGWSSISADGVSGNARATGRSSVQAGQTTRTKILCSREQSYTRASATVQSDSLQSTPVQPQFEKRSAFRPVSPIPDDLKHHTIRLGPGLKRSTSDIEAGGLRKRHVWSPATVSRYEASEEHATGCLPKFVVSEQDSVAVYEKSTMSGACSASTFYATTMTQLRESHNAPRKSLGMRRGTAGWQSAQPFKVPRLSKEVLPSPAL